MARGYMPNQYTPLILTYRELEQVLLPYIVTHRWGQDTIGDLWRAGAPIPSSGEERRVILLTKLMNWLKTIMSEQGQPLDATAGIYARLAQK